MAYVVNPDGTVTFIEVKTDRYGNIKPTGNIVEQTTKSSIGYSGYTQPKPKKKRKKAKRNAYYAKDDNNTAVVTPTDKPKPGTVKNPRIITRQSIDTFFDKKKKNRSFVSSEEFVRATDVLKGNLLAYFVQRNEQLKADLHSMGVVKKRPNPKASNKKNKSKHKGAANNTSNHIIKNTLEDIATFSTLKESNSDSDIIYNRPNTGGRRPKYGYARDYFGRVQERDVLNEERNNEFKQSQKQQSKYDYSSYDKEDDHDSFYDSGSYE